MTALRFDRLTAADVDAAVGLSTEAGWNQTPADWQRLLDLAPDGCLAGRIDGALVATATAAAYPTARWIGMVLVARAWRGRGFGTALLERALGEGPAGLDATDLGRPLYLRLGFHDVAPIDRWVGTLGTGATIARPLVDLDALVACDRRACDVDRRALLAHLAGEDSVVAWTVDGTDGCAGFAFLRPGRQHWHLGPIVCELDALPALLTAAANHLGGASVLVDCVRDQRRASLLAAHGLRVQRCLRRMTRPRPQGILVGPRLVAATSFEWG